MGWTTALGGPEARPGFCQRLQQPQLGAYGDALLELLLAAVRANLGLAALSRVRRDRTGRGRARPLGLLVRPEDVVRLQETQERVERRVAAPQRGDAVWVASQTALCLGLAQDPGDSHEHELAVAQLVQALIVRKDAERGEHARDEVQVVGRLGELRLRAGLGERERVVKDWQERLERLGIVLRKRQVCLL